MHGSKSRKKAWTRVRSFGGRTIEISSDVEYFTWLKLEAERRTVDIREQFALKFELKRPSSDPSRWKIPCVPLGTSSSASTGAPSMTAAFSKDGNSISPKITAKEKTQTHTPFGTRT